MQRHSDYLSSRLSATFTWPSKCCDMTILSSMNGRRSCKCVQVAQTHYLHPSLFVVATTPKVHLTADSRLDNSLSLSKSDSSDSSDSSTILGPLRFSGSRVCRPRSSLTAINSLAIVWRSPVARRLRRQLACLIDSRWLASSYIVGPIGSAPIDDWIDIWLWRVNCLNCRPHWPIEAREK